MRISLKQSFFCAKVTMTPRVEKIRVGSKALSAEKMGCCFLDEAFMRGFAFAFAAFLAECGSS
jgi:hypothetical protein